MRSGQTRYGAGDVLAVPAMRKDGTRVSIEFSIHRSATVKASMIGVAAVLRDVDKRFEEIKALRKELASMQKRLEGLQ
jgi:hypothetical protein